MNSNYILPVSIAAAIHGVLLFGFTKSPRMPSVLTDSRRVIRIEEHPKEPDLIEAIDPDSSNSSPKKLPDAPRPTNPEPITVDPGTLPTIALPPFEPATTGDTKIILPASVGSPDGDGTDWTRRIASSIHLDNSPRTRFQPAPHYPPGAKAAGMTGEVLVEFTVDEAGRVIDPHVVKSSDRMFEEPTLRAVAKWQFEPGRRSGRIVRFRMVVPVVFNLNE